jgi:RNA polymerase primary sigma factor
MSPEETRHVVWTIQNGTASERQNAEERLIRANTGLIWLVRMQYFSGGCGLESEDFFQAGRVGIIQAGRTFDLGRDTAFATHAIWQIRGAISHQLRENSGASPVYIPVQLQLLSNQVSRMERAFRNTHGRAPTNWEIREAFARDGGKVYTLAKIATVRRLERERPLSLQAPSMKDTEEPLEGRLLVDGQADGRSAAEDLDALRTMEGIARALDDYLREILRLRYFLIVRRRWGLDGKPPGTLEDVGNAHGISRERVRQIERETLLNLQRRYIAGGGDPSDIKNFLAFWGNLQSEIDDEP